LLSPPVRQSFSAAPASAVVRGLKLTPDANLTLWVVQYGSSGEDGGSSTDGNTRENPLF